MFITQEIKWHLLCCCHGNSSAAGPVLIETTIPSFCLHQRPSSPANLMMRIKTIWLPCVFQTGPSVLLWKIENEDIWFLTERHWSQESFHDNDPVGVVWFLLWWTFLLPSLKNTYFRDILYLAFYHLSFKPHNIISFSKTKNYIPKGKMQFLFLK